MSAASEDADVVTSSDAYARRFGGGVGRYFLERQADAVLELLRPWPGASVLDVGGGHGQLTGPLVDAGYAVSVLGSDARLRGARSRVDELGSRALPGRDLLAPGLAERSFDVVLSLRLLPHVRRVDALVATLARLARIAVVVDYPTRRSVNAVSGAALRPQAGRRGRHAAVHGLRRPRDRGGLRGARLRAHRPPAAVRPADGALPGAADRPRLARLCEGAASALGLTSAFGSPVVLRLERRG